DRVTQDALDRSIRGGDGVEPRRLLVVDRERLAEVGARDGARGGRKLEREILELGNGDGCRHGRNYGRSAGALLPGRARRRQAAGSAEQRVEERLLEAQSALEEIEIELEILGDLEVVALREADPAAEKDHARPDQDRDRAGRACRE